MERRLGEGERTQILEFGERLELAGKADVDTELCECDDAVQRSTAWVAQILEPFGAESCPGPTLADRLDSLDSVGGRHHHGPWIVITDRSRARGHQLGDGGGDRLGRTTDGDAESQARRRLARRPRRE